LRHNWPLECHGDDLAYFCDFLPLAAEDVSQSRLFLFRIVIFVKFVRRSNQSLRDPTLVAKDNHVAEGVRTPGDGLGYIPQ
jgi:hypothetical protein